MNHAYEEKKFVNLSSTSENKMVEKMTFGYITIISFDFGSTALVEPTDGQNWLGM